MADHKWWAPSFRRFATKWKQIGAHRRHYNCFKLKKKEKEKKNRNEWNSIVLAISRCRDGNTPFIGRVKVLIRQLRWLCMRNRVYVLESERARAAKTKTHPSDTTVNWWNWPISRLYGRPAVFCSYFLIWNGLSFNKRLLRQQWIKKKKEKLNVQMTAVRRYRKKHEN